MKRKIGKSKERVIIESVKPEILGGRFAVKREVGDKVHVEADIFADGQEAISAILMYKKRGRAKWKEVSLKPLVNDRWQASFKVAKIGTYFYTLAGWIDRFKSWSRDLEKRIEAGQDLTVELLIGADLVIKACKRAIGVDGEKLQGFAKALRSKETSCEQKVKIALSLELARLMYVYQEKRFVTYYKREIEIVVDRKKARFGTWYEMFPRSTSSVLGMHGSFKDCESRLLYIQSMGFDVLYLPPIHPIGYTHRKGKNNTLKAGPKDPGSPWAIGSYEGGHKSVHPKLGTIEDFKHLLQKAKELDIEIALDLSYQCAPDHPYVREHHEWFCLRPDGTVQYAENLPKKYEDIYPLNFEYKHYQQLWEELKSIVLFWIETGVRIFRVDNPHTKPFRFWEWLIRNIKQKYPDVIFLSEAFTRPKAMYYLAKLGFSQSYTYFAWRNTKWELTEYFKELTRTEVVEYFRPSLWVNTPDILTQYLQDGGRPAFIVRLVLAATLGTTYGIYGPAFELLVYKAKEKGSEEYLNSEKYEITCWDIFKEDSLRDFIARLNRIRQENAALQCHLNLAFHRLHNEQLLCYSKRTEYFSNVILVVVNLDLSWKQSGFVDLSMDELGLEMGESYQVHDLLSDAIYLWQGPRNYVELDPKICPAHIFLVRKRVRTEKKF